MTNQNRYLQICILIFTLCFLTGCPHKKDKLFKDTAFPEWSYDKPFYYIPADPPPTVGKFPISKPIEIYTNRKLIEIPRPKIGDIRKAPRIAIWLTPDNSLHWEKIGYFGLHQRFFPYIVDDDGNYGIRFIGPDIPPAKCKPPKPHMIFHVDTTPPLITVYISPDKEYYTAGDKITVTWLVDDINYVPNSTRISVCIDSETPELRWSELDKNYPETGSLNIIIPDIAIDKTMTIKVSAKDKAGNVSIGYSVEIPVIYQPPTTEPTTKPSTATDQSSPKVIHTKDGPKVLTPPPPEEYPKLEK